MPAVPTSQIRVAPQAPRVDTGAFIPKADPTGGLGLFTEAAKLPLMFETLDIQRARNKAEKAKLDLDEKQLNFTSRNFEALQQAKMMEDERKAKYEEAKRQAELVRIQAEAETATQNAAAGRPAPLAAIASLFGANAEATVAAQEPSSEIPEENVPLGGDVFLPPPATDKYAYRPDMSRIGAFFTPGQDAQDLSDRMYQQELSRSIPASGVSQREFKDLEKKAAELKIKFQPKNSTVARTDSNGIPFTFPAVTVGDEIIEVTGEPTIDVKALHEARPSQKAMDLAAGERLGKEDPSTRATRMINVQRLMNAKEVYEAAIKNGSVKGVQLMKFLPDSIARTFNPEATYAQDQVQSAIQNSLKEILGGAFTQKEGESLMARSFNLLNTPKQNFELMRQALQIAETALRDRDAQAEYFNRNGTLAGFKPESNLVNADGSANVAAFDEAISKLSSPESSSAKATGTEKPLASPRLTTDQINAARAKYRSGPTRL